MQTWLDFGAIVTMIALIYTIGKDISERNRRQAYSISCWIDGDFPLRHDDGVLPVIVSNPSEQPIYDAVVAIDIVDDNGARDIKNGDMASYVICIPPGTYYLFVPSHGGGANMHFNAAITFRDARRTWWHRDAAGKIERSCRSLNRYNISKPATPATIYRYMHDQR